MASQVKATVTNPTAALTDFTLIVDLSTLPQAWWDDVDTSDGTKGRVYKGDGTTRLACDWIDFDDTAETGVLRVKWTGTLATSGTQELIIEPPLAANASVAVGDTYGQHNAYDGDWKGYWPLHEAVGGTTDEMKDRTSNANHGTGSASLPSVTGPLGINAVDTNGAAGVIQIPYDASLGQTNTITALVWVNPQADPLSSWSRIFHRTNGTTGDEWGIISAGGAGDPSKGDLVIRTATGDTFDGSTDLSAATAGTWRQVGFSRDTGTGDMVMYYDYDLDGTDNTGETGALNNAGNALGIGGHHDSSGRRFDCYVAEAQVHDVVRADAWVEAEFDQTNANSTYWGTWTYDAGAASPQTLTLTQGQASAEGQSVAFVGAAATLVLSQGEATAEGQTVSITPLASTLTLTQGEAVAEGQSVGFVSSAATLALSQGEAVAEGQSVLPTPSAATLTLSQGEATAEGQAVAFISAAATLALSQGEATAEGQSVGFVSAAATLVLSQGEVTAEGQSVGFVSAAATLALSQGEATAEGQGLSFVAGTPAGTLALSQGEATAEGQAVSITPSAATLTLSQGEATAEGQAVAFVSAAITLTLTQGEATTEGQGLSFVTGTPVGTLPLSQGQATAEGQSLFVVAGEATVSITQGQATAEGQGISFVSGVQSGTITLTSGEATAEGQSINLVQTAVQLSLSQGEASAVGQPLNIVASPSTLALTQNVAFGSPSGQSITIISTGGNLTVVAGKFKGRVSAGAFVGKTLGSVEAPTPSTANVSASRIGKSYITIK